MIEDTHKLARHKTVRQALQHVADNPEPTTAPIDTPVWELVCRVLFDVAQHPDAKVRGGLTRASKAQRMIARRLVGKRRPGTHPAQHKKQQISFVDLTQGIAIGGGSDEDAR